VPANPVGLVLQTPQMALHATVSIASTRMDVAHPGQFASGDKRDATMSINATDEAAATPATASFSTAEHAAPYRNRTEQACPENEEVDDLDRAVRSESKRADRLVPRVEIRQDGPVHGRHHKKYRDTHDRVREPQDEVAWNRNCVAHA